MISAQEQHLLQRLLQIRCHKEAKLRRALALCQQRLNALQDRQANLVLARQAQVSRIRSQPYPEHALTPTELIRFKLTLLHEYQKERALAEALDGLAIERQQLLASMLTLRQDRLSLVKSQEKLQAVIYD